MTLAFEETTVPTAPRAQPNPYADAVKSLATSPLKPDGTPRALTFRAETEGPESTEFRRIRRLLTSAGDTANVTVRMTAVWAPDNATTAITFWTVKRIIRRSKTAPVTA